MNLKVVFIFFITRVDVKQTAMDLIKVR